MAIIDDHRTENATRMRVLIIGNYAPDDQYSMRNYAKILRTNLDKLEVLAHLVEPISFFGRIAKKFSRLQKITGYLDKYFIFPFYLFWLGWQYDCIHIVDHSNSCYLSFLPRRRIIITCHDVFALQIMLGEIDGEKFGRSGRILQRWVFCNLKKAKHIVCVSDYSREELSRLIGSHANIHVIPNSLPEIFAEVHPKELEPNLKLLDFDPSIPFFIHVGGNQFYKNRTGVLKLFENLVAHSPYEFHRLVLVGKTPDTELASAIASSPVKNRIEIRIDVSDSELRTLYSLAEALIFISLREGFGWPIIEAQACGCLVITSNYPPMSVVSGGAAILVDPTQPKISANVISKMLSSDLDVLRSDARINAENYSPHKIYPAYCNVYKSVINSVSR